MPIIPQCRIPFTTHGENSGTRRFFRTTPVADVFVKINIEYFFIGLFGRRCMGRFSRDGFLPTMRKAAIYTVGRQLNDGEMYIFSLYDLEPAGILVKPASVLY